MPQLFLPLWPATFTRPTFNFYTMNTFKKGDLQIFEHSLLWSLKFVFFGMGISTKVAFYLVHPFF